MKYFILLSALSILAFALPQTGTKVYATANTQWLVSWDAEGDQHFGDLQLLLTFRPAVNGMYSYCQVVHQNTAHTYTVLLPGALPCGDSTPFNMTPDAEVVLLLEVDGRLIVWRTGPGRRNTDGKVHAVVYGPMIAP
ncbi:MAG: hypothetical protein ABI693_07660 [Bryobacteraceae bacterium]